MASDIKNVKLGVCKITFDMVDLGYTKGGVEVTVKTDTHKVNVDQFGKTPINEYIMGREVMVKAPLAETTLKNLVKTMPGSSLIQLGGTAASGSVVIATNPADGETVVINGITITFKAVGSAPLMQVTIGGTPTATALNLASFINDATVPNLAELNASPAAAIVTITAVEKGIDGNTITLADGTAGVKLTLSGATLTGGVDGVPARVDVATGVGTNLIDFAKVLTLHPISKADSDLSEDFTIFKAATPGGLNFAYKLEDERVFAIEFNGYPDETGKLFALGDPTAV